MLSGRYVDPQVGKITFKAFYDDWSQRQLWVPSTRANTDLATGSVTFPDLPMKAIRRSHVEAWVKTMVEPWAPSTVKTRFVVVRSVFRAAVADRVITNDPSVGVALPRRRKAAVAIPAWPVGVRQRPARCMRCIAIHRLCRRAHRATRLMGDAAGMRNSAAKTGIRTGLGTVIATLRRVRAPISAKNAQPRQPAGPGWSSILVGLVVIP